MGKPVRKLRRFVRRKGKSKGKGKYMGKRSVGQYLSYLATLGDDTKRLNMSSREKAKEDSREKAEASSPGRLVGKEKEDR